MKSVLIPVALLLVLVCGALSAPVDNQNATKESKSVFGPAFDEIVVESNLTVRRKSPATRQGRTQNATEPVETIKTKRQVKPFGGAAANSQAQAFNSFGPVGSFGAAATGAQTQSFEAGPGGLFGSGGFAGTQQYMFNGQTVDIAFGNSFSGANANNAKAGGAAITITGPDGQKRPFQG